MRIGLLILASVIFLTSKAQTHLPVGSLGYSQWLPLPGYNIAGDSIHTHQNWYFTKYAGISAGYSFFNGGGGPFISAPLALQLNHPLNNNLVAFAAVTAAPTFYSFNRSFTDPSYYKSYPGMNIQNAYGLGLNSRVELGLMYVNDARTFSISGSIGVEQSSYPVYNPSDRVNYPSNRMNTKKQ